MHPILVKIGPLALHSYGLMVALGFMAAAALASRRAQALGLDPSRIQKVVWISLLAGILGARLAYLFLNWDLFASNPVEIIRLDHGGLVFYGGLTMGLAAGLWTIRRAGLPLLKTADLLIPPLVLAHAIGRIGCFLNGCCYGKPTSVPWAVAFPADRVPRHPTQLYESAFLLLLFLFLQRAAGGGRRPGRLLFLYGLFYGTWRFLVEFLRGDNPAVGLGLTAFQWASLPLALVCGWLLLRRRPAPASRAVV
ncbi:MAG: prolipoprotein diacylglyceryl transferase [Candidatus Omnitrophica bacterium]|nr:prolipoprotein diacylglyceryl transferase [Candidatus Omnitrophota bacterium]